MPLRACCRGLRLELDGFGVGYSVAELDGLTAMHGTGAGIEALNVEFLTPKLIERRAIVLSLLLAFCLRALPIDALILLPA